MIIKHEHITMNGNRKVNERKDNITWKNTWIDMHTKRNK